MCGIIGYLGPREAMPILLDGLKRLEYRGYDSAGVAVTGANGLAIRRSLGKLRELEKVLKESPLSGTVGIGHTRWATHGRPSEANAHPHRWTRKSPWCTTASSKTTWTSRRSCCRPATASPPKPTPRSSPT